MRDFSLSTILSRLLWVGLLGCSAPSPHVVSTPPKSPVIPAPTVAQPEQQSIPLAQNILDDYAHYTDALQAIKQNDDVLPAQFLQSQRTENAMTEKVRALWLASLGKRGNWVVFESQYPFLSTHQRSQTLKCYHHLASNQLSINDPFIQEIIQDKDVLPKACNDLLTAIATAGTLPPSDGWRRVWVMMAFNQQSDARNLAMALGQPLPDKLGSIGAGTEANQASLLYNVVSPYARNHTNADAYLETISGSLSPVALAFAHGILGMSYAKDLEIDRSLMQYRQADQSLLTDEQWQWYARALLRKGDWLGLEGVIRAMPQNLQNKPTWQYWLARSLMAQNRVVEAQSYFQLASQSGRNFYAILSKEALHQPIKVMNTALPASVGMIQKVLNDPALNRALVLLQASYDTGSVPMRLSAQSQWRYATRNYTDPMLIAASQVAYEHNFPEMSISSADKSDTLLNFNLRYPAPDYDVTLKYAHGVGLDTAWVYGLIRQESRFLTMAKSHVGASGLMQIMPGTARFIARHMGLDSYNINDLNDNINMGTWYLSYLKGQLNDEVLATAGYNAGPKRAERWQAVTPLEGAIYAETIPFNQTRDYVKKVMTNATYYANIFHEAPLSLTQRLGTVPAGDGN